MNCSIQSIRYCCLIAAFAGSLCARPDRLAAQDLWSWLPTVPESVQLNNTQFDAAQTSETSPQLPSALRPVDPTAVPPTQPAISESSAGLLSVPVNPLQDDPATLQVRSNAQSVSIFARNVDLRLVLSHLAQESNINIVVAENVAATVTTTLNDVPLWQALDAILKINGLAWAQHENIIYVTQPSAEQANPSNTVSGLVLQVFDLNYTSGADILPVVTGLLSPAGKAFDHKVDKASTRQTRERVVVEDYPERLQAIAMYIANVDNPPRQVLLEAHVLQVTLDESQRHGINLQGLARIANARVDVRAQGFANGEASPGFMMGLDGNDLDGMLEALRSNSAVRTLAAPKVLVVSGQEARIQIGSKFGYFVTTTSQTSTLQSVEFLDIGVVLQVEPTITHDGQVLLSVQPKVSGGRVNPDTGLPEEDTTEAQTTVILPDGKGMIIGGLIKESDSTKKSWIPWLGEQPFIGKLFRRSNKDTQRVEVIIALTPHIVPFASTMVDEREHRDYFEATNTEGVINTPLPYSNDSAWLPGPKANVYGSQKNEFSSVQPEPVRAEAVLNPFSNLQPGELPSLTP